jgi:hypothetical protein
MQKRPLLVVYKVVLALLGVTALVTEVVALVHRGHFNAGNFFSFFTVESNILAVAALLAGSYAGKRNGTALALFRGAAALYMATTGIVFSVLLSGLEASVLTAVPWDNTVLHYILPVAVVLDWILDPPRVRIPFKKALWWLAFPLAYLGYSLARGAIVGWYPYPFMDPAKHGYAGVAVVSVGVTLVVFVLSVVFVWLAKRGVVTRPAKKVRR